MHWKFSAGLVKAELVKVFYGMLVVLLAANSRIQAESKSNQSINDQQIIDQIEDELLFDPGVISTKIDVTTTNGIVTLEGSVNSLLAKERSARIAETVKGVRGVVNQIEVSGNSSLGDEEIKQNVSTALLTNPATDSYEISVSVKTGAVTLSGTVDSYQERELVKLVAKSVRGVTDLKDKVMVNFKSDRADAEIQADIEEGLRWNSLIDEHLISVTVKDAEVTLAGTVGSASEKRLAADDAWVTGVKSVDNSSLKVQYWAGDENLRKKSYIIKGEVPLEKAVNDTLMYDPRVMSFNVDVDAVGRTVVLRGTVDNLKAKQAAEQDARNTVGVGYVTNRIKVKPDTQLSNTEIKDSIQSKFLLDPYVERFEITTNVINGTAYLYGTVDSYFEKMRAEDLAAEVSGVVDVTNYLRTEGNGTYFYDVYVDDTQLPQDELVDYNKRSPYVTDKELKEEIESELWWSPFVESDEITVTVDDGVANLTGTADSWTEWRVATQNAYEGGATLVNNDITVNFE